MEKENDRYIPGRRHGEVALSLRLLALAEMVTPGMRVCDVGCDHGFLSIYLVQKQISSGVIAMDVRSGPLSRAIKHIAEFGLESYIELRLSDGLDGLREGEADTLVMAGMGGRLMMKILTRDHEKAIRLKELILQPQSELMHFREFLRMRGYRTVAENIIEEEGKFYPMMKAVYTGETAAVANPLFDYCGEGLLKNRHPVLRRYLLAANENNEKISKKLLNGAGSRARERLLEIKQEQETVCQALSWYDME